MISRIDRLVMELPRPNNPSPNSAAAVQELLAGKFGEMSTLMNYTFQSFNFRGRKKLRPFYDLVSSIAAEEYSHIQCSQEAGADVGRRMAKRRHSDHVIHGRDGRIREKNSYGSDPNPPKDQRGGNPTMPAKRLVQISSADRTPVKPRGPDRPPVEGPGEWDFVCPVCGRVLGKGLPEHYQTTVVLECWCGTYSTFLKP